LYTFASLLSGGFAIGYTLSIRRLPAKETFSMKPITACLLALSTLTDGSELAGINMIIENTAILL
jgi:hypothetical protein